MTRIVFLPRLAAVATAAVLGFGLSGLAQPAAAQDAPMRLGRQVQGAEPMQVQMSERERRRWLRDQERLQCQQWDRYRWDRNLREGRRGGGNDSGLWGRGTGELGDAPRYRNYNYNYNDYDTHRYNSRRGSGGLGMGNPPYRPGGDGG